MNTINYIFKVASELDQSSDPVENRASMALDFVLNEALSDDGMPDIMRVASFISTMASALDADGEDEVAAVLDEVLTVIANADPTTEEKYDARQHNKDHMFQPGQKIPNQRKNIEPIRDAYRPSGAPSLSTRHSPDLPGVSLLRVSDGVYQDPITHKVYDFNRGYIMDDGTKYPGGSVSLQTPKNDFGNFPRMFERVRPH